MTEKYKFEINIYLIILSKQLIYSYLTQLQRLLKLIQYFRLIKICFQGLHGIEEDVFLSLPCVLGENGVSHVIKQPLEEEELKLLRKSADTLNNVITSLKF